MNINKKQQELIKIYIGLFILLFVFMNWSAVSWVFNYRVVSGLAYQFFNPYQESELLVSGQNGTVSAQTTLDAAQGKENAIEYPYSEKNNSIEIPSLGLVTPLVIGQSTDVVDLERELDMGAVYYPGSVLPGKDGQIAVLGHSAPPNWPKIKHDWIFSEINNLQAGEIILLYFNNRQYTYRVTTKSIIKRGEELTVDSAAEKNNILTLVSCWPPGKDYQRITVSAELVKPTE